MFRRREDSLFDSPEAEQVEGTESKAASGNAPTPPTGAQAAPPVPPGTSRFSPETRANSGFRSASPLPSDMTRNRMPDTKTTSPISASPSDKTGKTVRRVLTVGSDILLKGEIATCDRLVIEGKVDATLNDVHTVEIAETGSFKGSAHIEDAEISGTFDGDLIVRGRLVIYGTGKVRGKIAYGEIEIESGGEISGEVKSSSGQAAAASASASSRTAPRKDSVAA